MNGNALSRSTRPITHFFQITAIVTFAVPTFSLAERLGTRTITPTPNVERPQPPVTPVPVPVQSTESKSQLLELSEQLNKQLDALKNEQSEVDRLIQPPSPLQNPQPSPQRQVTVTVPVTPSPVADNAPVDDDGNLLVDVGFGQKDGKPADVEKAVKQRLGAIAFAINSINTTTKALLTVDDLMKQLYRGGKFKAGDVDAKKLAAELDVEPEEVERTLLTKRFRSAWDPSGDFDPKEKEALTLTRSNLESEIDLGPGVGDARNKQTLYCAVKDLTRDQQAKLLAPRGSGAGDAFVKAVGKSTPTGPPKATHDTRL